MRVTIKSLTLTAAFQELETPTTGYYKLSGKLLNAAKTDWGNQATIKLDSGVSEHDFYPAAEELYIAHERQTSGPEMIRTKVSIKGTAGDILQYTYYHD